MKTLSRDGIQRMAGGISTNTSVSGGGGGGSTGIPAGWVEANFLSKDFFNLLFEVHINTKVTVTDGLTTTETNTPGVLLPNDPIPEDVVEQNTPSEGWTTTTHVSIESIEAKSNFWSTLAISALGQGSGGGGGSVLFEPLLSINTSGLAAPGAAQNGMTVVWNNTTHKWEYGSAGGGTDMQTVWAALAANTSEQINASHLSTALSVYATQTWVGQQGYLTSVAFSDLTSHPTTLSGYGITDAMLTKILSSTSDIDTLYVAGSYRFTATAQGTWPTGVTANYGQMLVICGGGDTVAQMFFPYGDTQAYLRVGNPMNANNGSWKGWKRLVTPDMNVASATKLATARTLWGQSFDGTANVSGNMSSVGSIEMSNILYMANGMSIRFKPNGGDGQHWNVLTMNADNTLAIGFYTRTHGQATDIQGGSISFAVNGGSGTAANPIDNRLEAMGIDGNGRVWIRQAAQGLRIGDGLITWDSGNNALKVQRISSGSVVDGGLYATSFISALGANTSGGGGGSATSGLATSYALPYTTNETYRYWHKLGTYQMNTEAMCLVIDLFTGNGYNGTANQNSWARIIIKKSNTTSGTSGAVGITCEQFGRQISDGKILVRINATAYNTGEVWVKCPWGYPKGAYSVQGNFTAWTHNNSTSGDSTTGPTHNQNDVGYYNNTSTMTTGE